MRRRNHKFIIYSFLVFFGMGFVLLSLAGCSDNPEAKAAKEMRNRTAQAVQMSVEQKDYAKALEQTDGLLKGNRSKGVTRDAALLASGNLALAKGRKMQEDLGLKALPLYGGLDRLEKVARNTEKLLVERDRIEMLLETDKKEITELRQWLNGNDQYEGLEPQLAQATKQMDQLLEEKTAVESDKEQTQRVLDDFQNKANDLMRQAELANGDKRLELEEQAFSLLLKRKEHYIEMQAAENKINVLNDKIALAQVHLDGIQQAIKETEQRIEAILNAEPRATLQKQIEEISSNISANRQELNMIAGELTSGLYNYREFADRICSVYEEAIKKFQQVRSNDITSTAALRAADGAYYAAMTCSAFTNVHNDIAGRVQMVLDSSDPALVSTLQGKLPSAGGLGSDYRDKMMAYFDQAVEGYEAAFQQAGRMDNDARCSIAKSQLLALHSKIQIADKLEVFEIANAAETAMDALIEKGNELGACFTQSEAMRVVNQGLDYMPSLPLNMDVFLDRKKQELSEWKRLPVSEQEAAVAENIQQIDELIAQYGQDVETQLTPLKQEMINARERGFKEPETSSGFGDPNSF